LEIISPHENIVMGLEVLRYETLDRVWKHRLLGSVSEPRSEMVSLPNFFCRCKNFSNHEQR
jgi:hypothetical protein